MAEDTRSGEAPPVVSGADIRTFLFADMRGYTRYTQENGDDAASALAGRFADLVKETVPAFEGELLELRGDEALCVFRSARQALRASVELQRRLRTPMDEEVAFPIGVGMGLDAGEAVPTHGGYRGAALNLAARLCGLAKPGEILATENVAHFAHRVDGLRLLEGRSAQLKGMRRPVRYVVVEPETPLPPVSTSVQPAKRWKWPRLTAVGVAAATVVALPVIVVWSGGDGQSLLVPANGVGVIDPGSGHVRAVLARLGDRPQGLAYGDGALWVAGSSADLVTQVDPKTFAAQRYSVGLTPTAMAFLNRQVWVAESGDGTLCEINPGSPRCVATPYAGNGPTAVVAADGALFVAASADGSVAEITPAGKITRRISTGPDPTALAFGYQRLWVANESAGTVTPIDLPSGQAGNPIPVGQGPDSLATGDGRVFVANHLANTVSAIDPNTLNVAIQPVPADPESVLVRAGKVWVACRGADEVVVLDAKTLAVKRSIPIGSAPESIASNPAGDVYVSTLPAARQARGGTLIVGTGDLALTNLPPGQRMPSLDPASWRSWNSQAWQMLWLMGDGLVTYKRVAGADGDTLVPDLAEQLPTVANGGLTYIFTLRPGLHYSNGTTVKASDIRYAIRRELVQNPPNARFAIPQFFSDIIGAVDCTRTHCEIARGITTDDRARTITFHLRRPSPDFLYLLATPFAFAVPQTTPLSDQLLKPIPMTGPYVLARYSGRLTTPPRPSQANVPPQALFVRNPRFRQWSADAQPWGYPDQIGWKVISYNDEVTAIERGRVDWTYGPPPPNRIAELGTRYTSLLHPALYPETTYFAAPIGQRPFNDPRVIRAIDEAIDRSRIAQLNGSSYDAGGLLALPTCQILPPNYPGYSPTCPYTQTGTAAGPPKLASALALARASGTAGAKITVTGIRGDQGTQAIAQYLVGVLDQLGYHAHIRVDLGSCAGDALSFCGWIADYPTPGDFLDLGLCSNPVACPKSIDRQIRSAYKLQSIDPARANQAWAQIDSHITRRGSPWIPVSTNVSPGLVSPRIGNFQWNPMIGALLDQLTIRGASASAPPG